MIITFDVETTGLHHKKDSLLSLSYLFSEKDLISRSYYQTTEIMQTFDFIVDNYSNATFIGHNIKFDLRFLDVHPDTVDDLKIIDTTILYHYLYPRNEKKLGSIEQHLFGTNEKNKYIERYGKKFDEWPKEELEKYNLLDVDITYRIYQRLINAVDPKFLEFQNRYLKALYRIEYFGIGFDEGKAVEETKEVNDLAEIKELELRDYIWTNYGYETAHTINFNSSKQLSNLLYIDLDIPKPERYNYPSGKAFDKLFTSTLTNADLLETINHPWLKMFLEWKKVTAVSKSIESYADLAVDNRLYPSFNITGTRTGRLSCVSGDTEILTFRGSVPIKNIVDGDHVWTHENRWQPVLHLIDNGVDDIYNIILCNGDVLTCNASHSILTTVGWITIKQLLTGEFNYECIKILGKESREHSKSIRDVSCEGYSYTTDNSGSIRDNLSQYSLCSKTEFVSRGEISAKESTLYSVKTWNKKSNEWKDRRSAPQFYRGVRRRVRLFDLSAQRKEAVCSQGSYDESVRTRGFTRKLYGTSYRSKSKEQQYRQFGTLHKFRSQTDAQYVSERHTLYSIEKIEFAGSARVFDLTVSTDHSYLTNNIFSHNCSQPNLQNIAKDRKGLPSVRNLFRPNEGEKLISIDYQQQEIRMLAVLSGDKALLELVNRGVDMHTVVGMQMFKKDSLTKEERDIIKNIHFAMLYGLSLSAIAFKIGSDLEYADHLVQTYYNTFPDVKLFMDEVKEKCIVDCGLTLFSGRNWVCLPGLEYQGINALIQGSCAELTAMAVIKVSQYLKKNNVGSILSIIHDETLYSLKTEDCIPDIVERMQFKSLFGIPFLVDVDYSY